MHKAWMFIVVVRERTKSHVWATDLSLEGPEDEAQAPNLRFRFGNEPIVVAHPFFSKQLFLNIHVYIFFFY